MRQLISWKKLGLNPSHHTLEASAPTAGIECGMRRLNVQADLLFNDFLGISSKERKLMELSCA